MGPASRRQAVGIPRGGSGAHFGADIGASVRRSHAAGGRDPGRAGFASGPVTGTSSRSAHATGSDARS